MNDPVYKKSHSMRIKEFKLAPVLLLLSGMGFSLPVYSQLHPKVYGIESACFRVTIDTTGAISSVYHKESKTEIPFHAKISAGFLYTADLFCII